MRYWTLTGPENIGHRYLAPITSHLVRSVPLLVPHPVRLVAPVLLVLPVVRLRLAPVVRVRLQVLLPVPVQVLLLVRIHRLARPVLLRYLLSQSLVPVLLLVQVHLFHPVLIAPALLSVLLPFQVHPVQLHFLLNQVQTHLHPVQVLLMLRNGLLLPVPLRLCSISGTYAILPWQ